MSKRMDCFVASLLAMTGKSIHTQKIAFPDFDAVVAQDAVGGGGVKVEIRERKIIEELLSLQRHGVAGADREADVSRVGALERFRLERLDIVDGFCEARLELIEGLFSIGRGRHLAACEARAAFSSEVADKLDLARQRQHVRIEPRAEQHLGLDVLRHAVRLGFAEDASDAAENLQECRYSSVVEGHVGLFRLGEFWICEGW